MDESVVIEFEKQQVGKLKLSQAIRIGAKLRPQSHVGMCVFGATCAQGAAAEALGHSFGSYSSTDPMALLKSVYPNRRVRLPCGCGKSMELLGHFGAIAHLNDSSGFHRWTRERIADWLESQGL